MSAVLVSPIRNHVDLSRALSRLEVIFHAPAGSPEGDESDILGVLVEAYEREHHPIPPVDPIDALNFWMDQKGLTADDLERCLGGPDVVKGVLNRSLPLDIGMIRALHRTFGIPADSLIGL